MTVSLPRHALAGCLAGLLCATLLPLAASAQTGPAPAPAQGQPPPAAAPPPAVVTPLAPPGETAGVPVIYRGREIYRVYTSFGAFTPEERARLSAERIQRLVDDPAFDPRGITFVDTETTTEIRSDDRVLGVVTDADSAAIGQPRRDLAASLVSRIAQVVLETREEFTARALIRGVVLAVLATVGYVVALRLMGRAAIRLRRRLRALGTRGFLAFQLQKLNFVSPEQGEQLALSVVRVVHVTAVVAATFVWLETALASLPWSQPYAARLVPYAIDPLAAMGQALLDFLPNLFSLAAIAALVVLMLRFVKFFFRQVQLGRAEFENFPPEWALPTYKLVRMLLIAIGVVMAYPYIPGSQSPAFQGVTLLIGFLVSLASSSALSNIIAGTILTYTRAFRVGDRVQVGDTVGDVVHTALLVTDIRTIKNVVVAIPNAFVLSTPIINYSRLAQKDGLILNTAVTIGYDAPWRTVHDLLIAAAGATPGIDTTPAPFVFQTALNDFYVSYEINAYTRRPNDMDQIYADLHAAIQDRFNEAGVEIMSPHYSSLRDGNTVTIPEAQRPAGYQAPGFRVTPPER